MIDTEKKVKDYKSAVETNFRKWQADPRIHHLVNAMHRLAVAPVGDHHGENEIDNALRGFVESLSATYPKFHGHDHGYVVFFPTRPHTIVMIDGSANAKEPYASGRNVDDGCSQVNSTYYTWDIQNGM